MGSFRALLREGDVTSALLFLSLKKLGSNTPMNVRVRGNRLLLRPNSPDLRVALEGDELSKAIAKSKPLKHGLIVDAGGYIGTAAIEFAKAFPDAIVVTVEPARDNFELLTKNTKPYANIIAVNKALAVSQGRASLHDRHTGQWGYTLVADAADFLPTNLYDVETTNLTEIVRQYGGGGIDLLKIDIEGAEKDLFENPCQYLRNSRVILVELHDRITAGCEAAFLGFASTRKNIQQGEKMLSCLW